MSGLVISLAGIFFFPWISYLLKFSVHYFMSCWQVRELDTNIKWDDIENTHSLPALDKQSVKSIRFFKKVIIRRKCTEGEVVKYLLDFGKRRAIPDIVKRHGSLVEESSSERRTYWLAECYVPLHLLKNFEEKKLARKSLVMQSAAFLDCRVRKRSRQKRGLSHLFLKAERSEYYQCGHCNKDVLIRYYILIALHILIFFSQELVFLFLMILLWNFWC